MRTKLEMASTLSNRIGYLENVETIGKIHRRITKKGKCEWQDQEKEREILEGK